MDDYLKKENPGTITETINILEKGKRLLKQGNTEVVQKKGSIGLISLESGCDLFKLTITRDMDKQNYQDFLEDFKQRSDSFKRLSQNSREEISHLGKQFLRDEMVNLIFFYVNSIDNSNSWCFSCRQSIMNCM